MLNRVDIIGRLGKDPKIATTQTGEKVASLSVACSVTWKDKDGNKKEHTDWIPVVMFGPSASFAERYAMKGDLIYVSGAFRTRKYTKKDGGDGYISEVVVQKISGKFNIVESKNKSEEVKENTEPQAYENLDDEIPF